jgi:predicted SAM-dependent methyltransferase
LLKECRRVLKKDGILRLATPDADNLMERFRQGTLSFFDEVNDGCAAAKSGIEKFFSIACSGHSSMYNAATLVKALQEAGFSKAQAMPFRESLNPQILRETYDMHPTLSTYVDAIA